MTTGVEPDRDSTWTWVAQAVCSLAMARMVTASCLDPGSRTEAGRAWRYFFEIHSSIATWVISATFSS